MAIDILCIPAMSTGPERVFSGVHHIISWDRMQLGAASVEQGECLKSWILSNIIRGLSVVVVDDSLDDQSQEGCATLCG